MSTLGKILLVEDDPGDVEMIIEVLTRVAEVANEIVVTRDGAEALDYLKKKGAYAGRANGNPIVVLLDIKLPKLNGIEVLREIKGSESLRAVPVVMLTSSREPADLNECYRLGVNAYVVKPVKFEDFFEAVKTVGIFWAMLNERPSRP
jgi:CheY-like chemotaxis protein